SSGPNRPFGLDTGDLEFTMERTGNSAPSVPIDLEDALPGSVSTTEAAAFDGALELAMPDAIELDLAGPEPSPAPASSVVTFGRPVSAPVPKHTAAVAPVAGRAAADPFAPDRPEGIKSTTELSLDLDRPRAGGGQAPALSAPGSPVELDTSARRPVRKAAEPARAAAPRRRTTLVLVAALGVVALGAGGWFAWTQWQGSQTRKDSASRGLKKAETLLADDAPGHWERAAAEAQRVLGGDPANSEALAVVAEANFAAVLDESLDVQARTEKGDKAIAKLRKAKGSSGPHAAKAEALRALLSTSFEAAIKKLDPLRDGDARLYLGWALAAHEQHEKAVQAFGAALAKKPKRIPAHYGLGLAKLEIGAHDDARKAFQAAIDASRDRFKRDHLGALIGLAQLAPVGEREDRYHELLSRPDLAKEPPRAVSRLKALAGDEAMRAGRLDQGKALYEEARALDQLNLRALVGLAVFSARTGDLAGARKRLAEVLAVAPNHIEAALALCGVAIGEGKLDEAVKLADGLLARSPPVANPILIARIHLARAAAFEASADRAVQEKAEIEYREAMKRADPGDFTAAVRLSILLTRLGKAKDAVEVLQPVKAAAQKDPDLSITLGGAYLAAGNGAAAAEAFQSALSRRPDDLEARFQLGQAQFMQGKHDQAIDTLRAAMDKDAGREDIGLALARMLEARGRIKDAAQVFDKLLAGKPSLTVRARAGRFFAREDMHDKAMAQGEAIRGESPRLPAGLFLLGEKLLAEGKFEEAQRAYRDATRLEPEAQYFEALARAAERLGQLDEALRQFGRASEIDPSYLAPRLGRARIRLVRREYALAIDELKAAQEIDPHAPIVMRDLGRAYLAMRDVRTAVPFLERATQGAPNDPEAHLALGQAYFDLGRAREAAGQLGRAVQLGKEDAPWRAEAYRMLGYASRSASNNRAALDAWRRYLELDQKDSAQRRDVQRLVLRLEAN
ncbi:MAG TPA: tetratricopeptide repeat protein, partial [Kofleriaceae bacterium]|nr:tetratricopeptide repeat protein [Kofleriaceae bacterium]